MFTVAAYTLFILDNVIRETLRIRQPNKFERSANDSFSSLLTSVFILSVLVLPFVIPEVLGTIDAFFVKCLGVLLLLSGIVIRIAAMKTLGKHYTGTLQIVKEHKLITHGIYHYVRHPGYLSVLLSSLGFSLAIGNILLIILVLLLYIFIFGYRITVEERMLRKHFGKAYTLYTKHTAPLIPFIW